MEKRELFTTIEKPESHTVSVKHESVNSRLNMPKLRLDIKVHDRI